MLLICVSPDGYITEEQLCALRMAGREPVAYQFGTVLVGALGVQVQRQAIRNLNGGDVWIWPTRPHARLRPTWRAHVLGRAHWMS